MLLVEKRKLLFRETIFPIIYSNYPTQTGNVPFQESNVSSQRVNLPCFYRNILTIRSYIPISE
jgi:hypothetical protein